MAGDCKRQLLAVFPLAPVDIVLTVDPIPAAGVPVIAAADRIAGPLSDSRAIADRFPTADAVYMVSPKNFQTGIGPFSAHNEGYTPAWTDIIHFVQESVSFDTLVAAHEKGLGRR